MTYDEYKDAMTEAMLTPASIYSLASIEYMNDLAARIEAAEAEHPEYAEMLESGL